ncbi:phosphate ABC transporter permease subunit PstC [Iocasia frigidifontis]|uniref:Phosphate transport system permease protein n=1 Tax=Iocasia fonsfrigidae TaxID=2682810 RepID=A0A8A7KCT5_9FIRM|nr:phosphate ABC transporter permease subunit PstC [Iocasia fonsfrigidae]QTL99663.1 phosphate ABC transporter permease subunit PstC [Iocasia fonsfrigidae]
MNKFTFRQLKDLISSKVMLLVVISVCLLFISIFTLLIKSSYLILTKQSTIDLLFSSQWKPESYTFGFSPAILGTFYVTLLAMLIAVPISIMAAIYIAEYASSRIRIYLQGFIDVLAGIPSVVFGLCALLVLVPFVKDYVGPCLGVKTTGCCIFTASVVLAVMIFPLIISLTVESLRAIPLGLKEQTLSLGTTNWQLIQLVLLKAAGPGIVSAIILALGRAFGETMAVAMVIGGKNSFPSLFSAGQTLPSLIVNSFGEMMSIPEERSALIFVALFLFIVVTIFNLFSCHLKNCLRERWKYE